MMTARGDGALAGSITLREETGERISIESGLWGRIDGVC